MTTRRLVSFLVLLWLVVGVGCTSVSVRQEHEEAPEFVDLKTFDWADQSVADRFGEQTEGRDEFDKGLKAAVSSELEARGFRRERAKPDFLVAYYVGARRRIGLPESTFGERRSEARERDWDDSARNVEVPDYEEGTLILDFVHGHTEERLWRGVAKGTFSENQSTHTAMKTVERAVKKIFEGFPKSAPSSP